MVMDNKDAIKIIVISALCLVSFINTLNNEFVWDDRDIIEENRYIRDMGHIPYFLHTEYWLVHHPGTKGNYRPLTMISLAIDYLLWQGRVAGYHITNILLHLINTLLLYFFLKRLTVKSSPVGWIREIPFVASLLFAVHPVHVESIVYVKNRADIFAMIFFLSAFLFFIKYVKKRSLVYLGASLFLYAVGILSKEMAVTLPAVLLAYTISFEKKEIWKKAALSTVPFFILAFLTLYAKVTVFKSLGAADFVVHIPLMPRVYLVLKTVTHYLKLLFFPVNLSIEHSMVIPHSYVEPSALFSIILNILILVFIVRMYISARKGGGNNLFSALTFFSVLWFIGTISSVSNIIYLASRPIAEQRLYIPSLGFCLFISTLLCYGTSKAAKHVPKERALKTLYAATAVIVAFYTGQTIKRGNDWRQPLHFWKTACDKAPNSFKARNNLGDIYLERGEYDKALSAYRRSISISPAMASTYVNLGLAYAAKGNYKQAVRYYKTALDIGPDHPGAHNNLAVVYYFLKDYDTALHYYKKSLELGYKPHPVFENLLEPYRKD